MDMDKLAHMLQNPDNVLAEVTVYTHKNGNLVRETITIDYSADGDYQWSRTTRPIVVE